MRITSRLMAVPEHEVPNAAGRNDPDGSFGKRGRPRDFRRVTASDSLLLNVRGRTVLSGARGEHRNRTQDYEGAANDP